jgi:glyoxylase-like metal-dependent hydrolase (beta-lactamase superfamily II)
MTASISPAELYAEIERGETPFILDVRNQDEYAVWQIEGPREVPMKNVPIWVAVEESESLAEELPDNTVVVCAHGNGSDLLIDVLKDEGRQVRTLEGGTAAWAQLLVPRELPNLPDGMRGWQIQRPSKACISYLIGVPGQGCIVVDPARFPEPYEALAAEHDMKILHVIDTHVHADHITGGIELAERHGASYSVPIEDTGGPTPFPNTPLVDGEVIDLGDAQVETLAIKMPGHTPGTTCVHIPGHLLLTGDTVFVRGVGRPDLTGKAEELAKELYHTVHDRLQPLDPATMVLPAHWTFADEVGEDGLVRTTLGHIFESTLLSEADLVAFVNEIVTSLPSAPDTYDTIRLVNSGQEATAEEIEFLEIGKNQCAASTTV